MGYCNHSHKMENNSLHSYNYVTTNSHNKMSQQKDYQDVIKPFTYI